MASTCLVRSACQGQLQVFRQAPVLFKQQCMCYAQKHYDPKFRKERSKKYREGNNYDFEEVRKRMRDRQNLTPDELRITYKKYGHIAYRPDQDQVINVTSSGDVIEPFVPPEGDGKSSLLTGTGYKERMEKLKMKGQSLKHVRTIKKYEEGFKAEEFAQQALEIFIEAQSLLKDVKNNEDRLHDLVTEYAYPQMVYGLEYKTFCWKYIEAIEPPTVVHARTSTLLSKENLYAQVTVRFHSKQILAIYDRFGRLMYGSENIVKDVLEYVVFEKHIVDFYGRWKVHAKIIPAWLPPQDLLIKTYRKPELPPIPEDTSKSKATESTDNEKEADSDTEEPKLATN